MEYKAKHRFADMSARKMRPFATLIRGRPADEALELLRFLPNKSARLLEQVFKSALGNAEDRGARDIEDLVVVESRIDGGPIMKRIQPRARGTAYPIKRRYGPHSPDAFRFGRRDVAGPRPASPLRLTA